MGRALFHRQSYPYLSGARHPQVEAIGESLDNLVRLAQEYKAYMEERVGQDAANPSTFPGVGRALSDHVSRIDRLIEILDNDVLDQFREIVSRINNLESRVNGRHV